MFTPSFYARRDQAMAESNKYRQLLGSRQALMAGETEIDKYYTFDEKGHIMVVTTSKDTDNVQPAVAQTFQKVIVFFGAWTAALARAGKTLFDYEAVTSMITKSGFFVSMGTEKRSYRSESTSVALDTSIIQGILGAGITGGGMAIAKRMLANIGTTISASYSKEDTKKEISHLLFICESLMGFPIVSISLYHTKLEQHSWVSTTNCSKVSKQTVAFDFEADDYLFVDPQFIDQFSNSFEGSKEFDDLIEKLSGYIEQQK
jgi:hypothetical protein